MQGELLLILFCLGFVGVFGLIAAVLWFRREPGPRWPWHLLVPLGTVNAYILLRYLQADPDYNSLYDLTFLGSWAGGLLTLRWICALFAIALARGSRAATLFAVLALLSLDPRLVTFASVSIACSVFNQCP
jgi:hypothetical protein